MSNLVFTLDTPAFRHGGAAYIGTVCGVHHPRRAYWQGAFKRNAACNARRRWPLEG